MSRTATERTREAREYAVIFDPMPVNRAMAIRGFTLDDVARRVGCSRNAVWRITKAKCPRPAHLHGVCKLLGVNVEDCYPLPETVK